MITHEPTVADRAKRVIQLADGRIVSDVRQTPTRAAAHARAPPAT